MMTPVMGFLPDSTQSRAARHHEGHSSLSGRADRSLGPVLPRRTDENTLLGNKRVNEKLDGRQAPEKPETDVILRFL